MSDRGAAIGLWSGVGLVVASMVGTGVLVSNGFMVSSLSPGQTFGVWVVQALMAIAGAIAYARISQLIPRSGGEYRYLSDLFHPALGYVAGWTSLLVGFAAPVAAAAVTAGSFAEELGAPTSTRGIAAIIIVGVTISQMVNLRAASWSQNVFVAIKAALFLALIAIGLALGSHSVPPQAPSPASAGDFAHNLFYAAFAFSGWNASIYAAEEFQRPRTDVARSMIIGVVLVTVLYLAVTCVFVFNLTPADVAGVNQERSAHLLVAKLIGSDAAFVASIGIILTLVSAASAMTMVGPRVNASMAADGFLPRIFAGGEGRPPVAAILLQGSIAMILVFAHSIGDLIANIGLMLTIMSALTVMGLVRVRFLPRAAERSRGEPPGLFSVAAALLFFGAACWMIYYAVAMAVSDGGDASGLVWVAVITAAALAAYVMTRRVGRRA